MKSDLDALIQQACQLLECPYGILILFDGNKQIISVNKHGIDTKSFMRIKRQSAIDKLNAKIVANDITVFEQISTSQLFATAPKQMPENICAVAMSIYNKQELLAKILLCDTQSFSPQRQQLLKIASAGYSVALKNIVSHEISRKKLRWLSMSQQITTLILEGADEEYILQTIAKNVKKISHSDTVLIALPSIGQDWVCEIADGLEADDFIGLIFPPNGRTRTVIRQHKGMFIESFARTNDLLVPQLQTFGSALYVPLMSGKDIMGVLIMLRKPNKHRYAKNDLPLAQTAATQIALSMELSRARENDDLRQLFEEKDAIARDLHDFVIQQLFATSMNLYNYQSQLEDKDIDPQISSIFEAATEAVATSIKQIRSIVHKIRYIETDTNLLDRLAEEASIARSHLGFAPSIILNLNGTSVTARSDISLANTVNSVISASLCDDIIAVVRETLSNTARHARASSVIANINIFTEPLFPEGKVQISICDDGVGLSDIQNKTLSGILNLQARAKNHNGTYEITNNADNPKCKNTKGAHTYWSAQL